MQKIIDAIAHELWVAINDHDKTFEWKMNWFLHRKIEDLWTMLDSAQELQKKENDLKSNNH